MNKQANVRATAAAVILSTAIGFGVVAVWVFALLWGTLFYHALFQAPQGHTALEFAVDGEALLVTREPALLPTTVKYRLPDGTMIAESSTQRLRFRTLDGKPVEEPPALQGTFHATSNIMPAPVARSHLGGTYGEVFGYLSSQPPTMWYLILVDEAGGRAYFEGFDPQTKLRVGYLSLRGFSSEMPPLEAWFDIPERLWPAGSREPSAGSHGEPSGSYDGGQYVMSGNKAYFVDFDSRSVAAVELPGPAVALGHTSKPIMKEGSWRYGDEQVTLIRLKDEIRWLDGRSVPIPEPIRDQNLTLVSTLGDEVVLLSRYQRPSDQQIYWLDAAGKVTRHATLPYDPAQEPRSSNWEMAVGAPMPVVLAGLLFVSQPQSLVARGAEDNFTSALAATLPEAWAPFACVCLVSAVLAVWCYVRHRRYSPRGATGWAVFVLLMGLPGLIGYLLHREWPARVACASCGAAVPRDSATCMACTKEFAAPALTGTEVFA